MSTLRAQPPLEHERQTRYKPKVGSYDDLVRKGQQELAAKGRREALAAKAAESAEAVAQQRRDAKARALMTVPALRSISSAAMLGTVTLGASVFLLSLSSALPLLTDWGLGLGGGGVSLLMWLFWRRATLQKLARTAPFEVVDLGIALDYSRSYPTGYVRLDFKGELPPPAEVVALFSTLRSSLYPQTVSIESSEAKSMDLAIKSDIGSKFNGHRRWLARWFRRAVPRAFVPLHGKYPLERIVFR